MNFLEYYFTEYEGDIGTGAATNRLAHELIAPGVERSDELGPSGAVASNTGTVTKPKKPAIKKYNGKGKGSYGYMIKSPDFYDIVKDNVANNKYGDNLISHKNKNQEKMKGIELVFKPQGIDADDPDINRSVEIYQDKDKDPKWSVVVFDGKNSFKDIFKFLFSNYKKDDVRDLSRKIKWNQASPKYISDPHTYGNWNQNDVPQEDEKFLIDFLKDMKE